MTEIRTNLDKKKPLKRGLKRPAARWESPNHKNYSFP